MYIYFLVVFLVANLQYSSSLVQRNFYLEYYDFKCIKYSKNVKLFECNFEKTDKHLYLFNVRMMFSGKVGSQFSLRFLIDVTPKLRKNKIRFIDSTFNGCDELNIKYDNPIIKYLTQEIRRSGNLPFECPFKENFLYEIRNFSYSDNFLPTFLPLANFTVTIQLRDDKENIGSISTNGAVVPKSKE